MSILLGIARDELDRARELRRLGLNRLAEEAEKRADLLYEAADAAATEPPNEDGSAERE
jgi:hypothetical protein